jgi:CBS domain-containing protein
MRLIRRAAGRGMVDELRTMPVASAMASPVVVIYAGQSLADAQDLFDSSDLRVLPVVNAGGAFHGVVTRSDVMSALLGVTTPTHVGGLATPLGVFLTTGHVRGGASDFGLFLTGVTLVALFATASLITNLIALGVERWRGVPLFGLALNPKVMVNGVYGGAALGGYGEIALMLLQLVIFFILLRLAPLTGTHAAEHMVVHAVEDGDELTPERVATKPRVHPRCGTNLMALLFITSAGFYALISMAPSIGNAGLLSGMGLLVVIVYLVWRGVGSGLQRFITTRRPSGRQLQGAIAAATQLLARHQRNPSYRARGIARLWNIGFIQVGAGFICAWIAAEHLSRWLHLGILRFGG